MALLKVLLLLLGLVNSAVSLQKRIIGGHDCADTERGYHVRLKMTNGQTTTICGGSLLNQKWILTTYTCWKSETGWINVALLKVHPRTGTLMSIRILDAPVVYAPEGWKHDIMLVMVGRPVRGVPFAQLPDCSKRPKIGDIVQLAGEGGTTTGPNNRRLPNTGTATRLQCVNMKVVEDSHFLPAYGHTFSAAAPNTDGDAGSAVVFNGMIYGVISAGVSEHPCQRPVSITDVCGYFQWIRGITRYQ
ncbi:kallikrein 1-related peptidase b27-like isoform X2 [Poecilia reticulata]|uniref:kallikrein 1-related peptidase b27-like isoform X2 n=1 Tax=Poecilia reticulata TaxID=8081 RepID=UPI0004A35D70|nr:PREDICTED: kallikrein 1-related peptidase b27-like isoform X2 [Poecilia reticulata]